MPMRLSLPAFLLVFLQLSCAQENHFLDVPPSFRSDTNLVLVPVNVMDSGGANISGLGPANFTVRDNKTPQPIVSFHAQDAPCSVGIILDTSSSMRTALSIAKEAVREFLHASNQQDDFFLLTVSSEPEIQSEVTDDLDTLQNSLVLMEARGDTALIDTIYLALNHTQSARNPRRALLVVSDGMDNHSRYSKAELLRVAIETDTQIYTVAIDGYSPRQKAVLRIEAQRGLMLMDELAAKTGGVGFVVRSASEAPGAAAKVGLAIRNQYVLGFQPSSVEQSGKWHKIQVQVDVPKANVSARNGYYVP